MFQGFVVFSDLAFTFCETDKNFITRNSSSERCYFVFIDLPTYRLQTFCFGEAEAPFLHQLKTPCNYSSSWKGRAVGRPNVWLFTPLNPFTCLNYAALCILSSFAALYSVIQPLFTFYTVVFKYSFDLECGK